jgi:hypothetical protein
MSFRLYVRKAETEARRLGVRLSMLKLRDAISRSIYNRPYSAAVAAENAGTLPPLILPPPYIHSICEHYRIDPTALQRACESATGGEDPAH